MTIQSILTLLMAAMSLLTAVQSNPNLPVSFKELAISTANRAITYAQDALKTADQTPVSPAPVPPPITVPPTIVYIPVPTPASAPSPSPAPSPAPSPVPPPTPSPEPAPAAPVVPDPTCTLTAERITTSDGEPTVKVTWTSTGAYSGGLYFQPSNSFFEYYGSLDPIESGELSDPKLNRYHRVMIYVRGTNKTTECNVNY